MFEHNPKMPLFHWAPTSRRKQILKYGLRPRMASTTNVEFKAPWVCFAESPSWAWALSGALRKDVPEWDLWQTELGRLIRPDILATYDTRHMAHEVRARHRVYKSDLWYVGSRSR